MDKHETTISSNMEEFDAMPSDLKNTWMDIAVEFKGIDPLASIRNVSSIHSPSVIANCETVAPMSALPETDTSVYRSIAPGQNSDDIKEMEKLGEGGMGIVFVAEQKSLKRLVAVKKIKSGTSDEKEMHFIAEGMVTGELDHPNIVPIHIIGKDKEGRCFYAMKLINGLPWSNLLHPKLESNNNKRLELEMQAENMTIRDHLGILQKVCDGIAYAHSKNIVHRDLKPENVMVGEFGEVLVMDWGLALNIDESENLSRKGIKREDAMNIAGTLAYMAPEQVLGDGRLIDERTDIFLLGAILYEMLTGTQPHSMPHGWQAALIKIKNADYPLPGEKAKGKEIPTELKAICLKAMSKDRADRYQNAEELSKDISFYLEGRAVSAKEDSLIESIIKLVKRNKGVSIISTVAFILLVGLAAFGYTRVSTERNAAKKAEIKATRERDIAISTRIELAAKKTELERDSYFVNIRLANEMINDGDTEDAYDILKDSPEIFRDWEWGRLSYLSSPEQRDFVTFQGQAKEVTDAKFSPDGLSILTTSKDGTAIVWDRLSEEMIMVLDGHKEGVSSGTYSADGKIIATAGHGKTVRIWSAETGQLLKDLKAGSPLSSVAISPNDKLITTGDTNGQISTWNLKTGKLINRVKCQPEEIRSISFSPDSKTVVVASRSLEVKVINIETGKTVKTLPSTESMVFEAIFTPDGKEIITCHLDGNVRVWRTPFKAPYMTFRAHPTLVSCIAVSGDGKYLLTGSTNNKAKLWDLKTGKELKEFRGHTWFISSVDFSKDNKYTLTGSWDKSAKIWSNEIEQKIVGFKGLSPESEWVKAIISGNRQLVVANGMKEGGDWKPGNQAIAWDAVTKRKLYELKGHTKQIIQILLTPDDRQIVTISEDKTARSWNSANGKLNRTFTLLDQIPTTSAISSDGKTLAVATKWEVTVKKTKDTDEEKRLVCHILLLDLKTGDIVKKTDIFSGSFDTIAFSPDGKYLAAGENNTNENIPPSIFIIDVSTGKTVKTLKGHKLWIFSLVFSKNGKKLLSCSWDNTIRLWDLNTGKPEHILAGHRNGVNMVAFSPDEKRIVTASEDKTVRLWDTRTGQEVLKVFTGKARMTSAVFSADGLFLLIAGKNGFIKLLPAENWKK